MPPGPLPTGTAERRNKPTIPTTELPASGRSGRTPKPPATYKLGPAGEDWWRWAWKTSQACGWDDGVLFVVARRAQLEDDRVALERVDGLDIAELLDLEKYQVDKDAVSRLEDLVQALKRLAGGKLAVERECRELDDRLGLTPKGLAALRWKILPDEEIQKKSGGPGGSASGSGSGKGSGATKGRRGRLQAV